MEWVGGLIIVALLYTPVIYRINRRIAFLEEEVRKLKQEQNQ